jgi:hypothetical protein
MPKVRKDKRSMRSMETMRGARTTKSSAKHDQIATIRPIEMIPDEIWLQIFFEIEISDDVISTSLACTK